MKEVSKLPDITNNFVEQFFLNNFDIDRVFNSIERADYLFLYYIKSIADAHEGNERVYLSDLADTMNLSIPELSKEIENLQDKGYVMWKTDSEAGKTYVKLTSKAVELMRDEIRWMKNCYTRIRDEIGEDELEKASETVKKINTILKEMKQSQASE